MISPARSLDGTFSAPSGVSSDYTNDAYRMSSEGASTSPGSAPRNASSVYPSAPPNLRIEIDAKRLGGESLSGYAIACRADTTATGPKPPKGSPTYNFLVGDGYAIIAKEDASPPYYRELKHTETPAIDVNATNHIQAECTNVEGEQAVHLVFSVNGQVIAEETDRENPLLAGTVALFVFNGVGAEKAVEVEFDNFVVTETRITLSRLRGSWMAGPEGQTTAGVGRSMACPFGRVRSTPSAGVTCDVARYSVHGPGSSSSKARPVRRSPRSEPISRGYFAPHRS